MGKITAYTSAGTNQVVSNTKDFVVVDSPTKGTRRIRVTGKYDASDWAQDFVYAQAEVGSTYLAGVHNSLYRGKYLGSALTEEQLRTIKIGRFQDLWIGDYWTISSVNYRIAAFDYWMGNGHQSSVEGTSQHHVCIVPDNLYAGLDSTTTSIEMNPNGADTSIGYINSSARATLSGENTIPKFIRKCFDYHLISHYDHYNNYVTPGGTSDAGPGSGGIPAGGSWYYSTIDLMNETMVFGHHVMTPNNGPGYLQAQTHETENIQLPLFRLAPEHIPMIGASGSPVKYWLRNPVRNTQFASVNNNYSPQISVDSATTVLQIRPIFGIG